jgi:catechol 2,3-dioxygenase-like lactoylglutathione lyase family enzyme
MNQLKTWSLTKLHHLGITVKDIDVAIESYRGKLGMELIGRLPSVTADYVAQQTGYDQVELNVALRRESKWLERGRLWRHARSEAVVQAVVVLVSRFLRFFRFGFSELGQLLFEVFVVRAILQRFGLIIDRQFNVA